MGNEKISRRKFLYIGAGAALAAAAGAAYYATQTPTPTKPVTTTTAVTTTKAKVEQLTIAAQTAPWMTSLRQTTDLYPQETGTKINWEIHPSLDAMMAKQREAATVGSGVYDLFMWPSAYSAFFLSQGYVTPLQDVDPNFKPDPNLLHHHYTTYWPAKADGKVYGLMIFSIVTLFYYRKDLLDKYGFAPPKTWTDVVNICEKVHDPSKNLYGFGVPLNPPVDFNWWPIHRSFGTDLFADETREDWTIVINNDAGIQAMNFLTKDLAKYMPPGWHNLGVNDIGELMRAGKLAMNIGPAALVAGIDDPKKSAVPGLLNTSITPRADVKNGRYAPTTGSWGLYIPKASKNKLDALDFMKWMSGYKAQYEFTKVGGPPTRSDIMQSDLLKDPQNRWLDGLRQNLEYVRRPPICVEYFDIRMFLDTYLPKTFAGELSAKEGLDTIARKVYDLMKEKGYNVKLS